MKRVLIAGGDRRMACLAALLKKDGYEVETLGIGPEETEAMRPVDAVLLPYPFSLRNGLIPSMDGLGLRPETVWKWLGDHTIVLAGRGMEEQASPNMKRYHDAAGLEKRNAELSAEAAVMEAMQRCETALMDARALVTGYGLFGRALARRLKALGAEVWVAARRRAQREDAQKEGMRTVSILEMESVLPSMDLVLNTIPARIFGEYHLRTIPRRCWLLELASAPYGFDVGLCEKMGLNCALLPGLPGRYSPQSAALALRAAVLELLEGGQS